MSIWAWEIGSKGFLLTPGDRTHCGGYILSNENGCTVKGMVIACEGGVYICGLDSQRYQIEGGVPDGSWIEAGSNLFRDTWKSPFYDDIDPQGRKIIPHSEGLKRLHEDTGLQRRSYDSLRSVNEKFEHDEFIGTVGGILKGRKRIITGEKKNIHSTLNMNTGYRTRIAKNLFDSYLRMGRDLSNYETEIICLLAGSAHSRGSCKCHCRFIPRLNITYRYDRFIISSYQSANTPEKPISAPVLARRIPRTRQSVEPGFCVVPDQTTPKSYERELMVNPLSGVRELYRLLNPEKNKKPGSILIVADPEQQNLQKNPNVTKSAR